MFDHDDRAREGKAPLVSQEELTSRKMLLRHVMQSIALSNLDKDNGLKKQHHKSKSWLVEGGNSTQDILLLPVAPASD